MMETKSEYKLTEIGKIPVEWDISRMESIGSTYGGLSGKTKDDFEDGNENFVSYRQIFNNPLLKNEDFEMVRIFEKENQNEVKYGDVLFTTSSETPNEVAMSSVFLIEGAKKHFLNSFSFGYRWNQLEIIDPKYYGYYFRGEYFRRLTFKLAQGSTRYNISKNKLVEELIHVPPLNEQQKIAEILSTVDEQIEQTDQLIEKTKELKKGIVQHLLKKGIGHTEYKQSKLGEIPRGWKIKKISEIASVNPENIPTSTPDSSMIKYIDIESVNNGRLSGFKQLFFKDAPSRAKRIVKKNDIILSTVRPYLKAFAKVNIDDTNLICSTGFAVIRVDKHIDSEFIYQFIFTDLFLEQLLREMRGSSYPAVNSSDVSSALCVVPPLEEQQKIAEILSSIDEEIDGYQKEKAKYEELKKGLMQQLLTGKKRVKV